MKLRSLHFELKFKYPFTISKGTKTHQPTFVVELEHFGIKGYGEAPAIGYYNISLEKMEEDFVKYKPSIERFAFTEPERFWHFLHHLIPHNHFLVCALDMAAWDLYGKMCKKPLYKIWRADITTMPLTNFTIGIDEPQKMVAKMKEMPWPVYKVKVGTTNDMANIEALRKNTAAVFRVDANAGWDLETAQQLIPRLKELGVEYIEQPIAKDNWEEMKILYEQSPLPLFADESCVYEKDVEKCHGYFHGINIKLTKCGGITPARRMIAEARKLGLLVMLGCMNESTIGTAALAHLLPFADYGDLDGPLLLAEDLATGIRFHNGAVILSDEAGLGVRFNTQ